MNDAMTYLLHEREFLQQLICKTSAFLAAAPDGHLYATKVKGRNYFSVVKKGKDGKVVKNYLGAKKRSVAVRLAQKLYYEKLNDAAKTNLAAIDTFLKKYKSDIFDFARDEISKPALNLMSEIPQEYNAWQEAWCNAAYTRKSDYPQELVHPTIKGDMVRSKSEGNFMDALFNQGIAYRYEAPLRLGTTIIHPDATILDPSSTAFCQIEIPYEHFGMMDNPEYARKAYNRLALYSSYGYYPGINMICTFETKEHPFSYSAALKIIRYFFG